MLGVCLLVEKNMQGGVAGKKNSQYNREKSFAPYYFRITDAFMHQYLLFSLEIIGKKFIEICTVNWSVWKQLALISGIIYFFIFFIS